MIKCLNCIEKITNREIKCLHEQKGEDNKNKYKYANSLIFIMCHNKYCLAYIQQEVELKHTI